MVSPIAGERAVPNPAFERTASSYACGRRSTCLLGVSNTSMRRFVSIKSARCSRLVASAAGCSLLRAFVVRCSPSRPADSAAHARALGGVSFSFTYRAPNPAFQATAYGRA